MDRRSFLRLGTALRFSAATAAVPALAATDSLRKQIKITDLETDVLRMPPRRKYFDAIHEFGTEGGGVALRIHTDAGITGWAYSSFGAIGGGPRALEAILQHEVKPVLLGKDPAYPKRIRADLWKALEYAGVQGITQFAIAAADIAIWDILGKAANLPVYKMIGANADRMPVYNMCGWYYENDNDLSQFKRQISDAFVEGFHAVKIKVGRQSIDDDIRRIEVARQLYAYRVNGPPLTIKMDSAQS